MAPPQLSSNTAPILALVGVEIFSLMAFVGVCEARAADIALCKIRWSLALPAIALAGHSAELWQALDGGADRWRRLPLCPRQGLCGGGGQSTAR
jgi:hypothetical protein